MNKAIFLDRDGTINVDDKEIRISHLNKIVKGYIHKIEDWEWIPRALDGLKIMSKLDFKLIIITSQSGIGRGYFSEDQFNILCEYIKQQLSEKGIKLEGIYLCPHYVEKIDGKFEAACECRKPGIALMEQAAKEHNIDLKQSYMIGDKTADIECGKRAGCKTILVKTGKGGKDKKFDVTPDFIAEDLYEAAEHIKQENES
jgi:D-glycero-D-manno-heptose 1,7-bisphosphate phosphatase